MKYEYWFAGIRNIPDRTKIKLKEKVREKRKIYAYDICTLQIWKRSDQRASEAASQHS